jgi:hypothetical protein
MCEASAVTGKIRSSAASFATSYTIARTDASTLKSQRPRLNCERYQRITQSTPGKLLGGCVVVR